MSAPPPGGASAPQPSGTPSTGEQDGTTRKSSSVIKDPIVIGAAVSLGLLAVLITLEYKAATTLKVPPQWLALAAVPVLVGLAAKGYIGDLNWFGISAKIKLKQVEYVRPGLPVTGPATVMAAASSSWQPDSAAQYERTHWLQLVHVYIPSKRKGQKFDVSIYLMKHVSGGAPNQTENFAEVDYVEFFFGPSWGNQIYTVANNNGVIGISTSAWGMFLAACRVYFKEDTHHDPVVLYRYIDFEMASRRR